MKARHITKKRIVKEDISSDALVMEKDHEVGMAKADLYKLAKYSIELHRMLQNISEDEGLEGWVQSKITKAADYISSVKHHLEYNENGDDVTIVAVPTNEPQADMPEIQPAESIKGE